MLKDYVSLKEDNTKMRENVGQRNFNVTLKNSFENNTIFNNTLNRQDTSNSLKLQKENSANNGIHSLDS